MNGPNSYKDFTARLKLLSSKHPDLITTTLSNVFTMRLIGNKTHGDLAEIAIAEFINQYMYDFRSIHVGKDLYRAKSKEEDIKVINEITKAEFPVSLKAYGDGPLQLSTDKNFRMFPRLEKEGSEVKGPMAVQKVLQDPAFVEFRNINVLPLIYDEEHQRCNILVFDYNRAMSEAARIAKEVGGKGRKHPVYRFYNIAGDYICEVRYGDAAANALQRGLWTHTKNGLSYFESITGGWIDYSHNPLLVKHVFSCASIVVGWPHSGLGRDQRRYCAIAARIGDSNVTQLPLFGDIVVDVPPTQGIKYAGSKLKLLPHILQMVEKVGAKTVLDGFSGTTRVSQALARRGYTVVCNDVAAWSKVFGTCYLLNKKKREEYQALIDHLNAVRPMDGWFTQHYGGRPNDGCAIQRDGRKKPWQIHNTRKLDAIRQEIEALALDPVAKAVALTSLMLALDRVDSSLGHFAAYLKDWSPRSYGDLVLDIPHVVPSSLPHQVFQRDILDLVPHVAVDLAYFDPPYGSNNEKMPPSRVRYAAYYHVWTSVVLFDKPDLFGKANRRCDTADSVAASAFEEFRRSARGRFKAVEAIEQLIEATPARWTILSYSSGGRATAQELDDVLRRHGKLLDVVEVEYKKNVMAGMKWTHEWTRDVSPANREFLFLLEKRAA